MELKLNEEQLQIVKRWAQDGAKRLRRVGGNPVGNTYQDDLDHFLLEGYLAAARLSSEVAADLGQFERYIYMTIWREKNWLLRKNYREVEMRGTYSFLRKQCGDEWHRLASRSDLDYLHQVMTREEWEILWEVVEAQQITPIWRRRGEGMKLRTYQKMVRDLFLRARRLLQK